MWSRLKEKDAKILEEVLLLTTPVSKYSNIEDWYKDFKTQMRKKMRDKTYEKRKRNNSKSPKNVSKLRKI